MSDDVFLPWGVVTPEFWTVTEAVPGLRAPSNVPVAERIAEISALATEGALKKATLLAGQLDEDHTAACGGTVTTATADIREIRGYLASLSGDHRAAVGWYLHMVRLRAGLHGPHHPDTEAAVRRTYSLWRGIGNPVLSHRLGQELLTSVIGLQGPHSAAAVRIRQVLARPALEPPA
ncbi:hypothetical protein ABZ128_10340 [Streptomyces sp. NPDC006326]|uniref:hypothetical protein n=1 Tax=Streptomyces sp. NPDC006326 TaxID=3156752 RepID=UPI0033AE92E9